MTAKPIIENFNVFKDVQPGLGPGGVLLMKNQLSFEGTKETFDGRVVVTIAFAAHTTHHLVLVNKA